MKVIIRSMLPIAAALGCMSASTAFAQASPYDPTYPSSVPSQSTTQYPNSYTTPYNNGYTSNGMISTQTTTNEVNYSTNRLRAPGNAFELKVGVGYTQGFGNFIGSRNTVGSVAQEGVGFGLGLGYRINPRIGVGVEGEYQEFRPASSLSAEGLGVGTRGLAGNINASYHILPFDKIDPYVQLGTGYRALWTTFDLAPNVVQHGFELAKLQVGVDVRMTEDIAVAPVIGADLTTWAFANSNGNTSTPNIGDWGLTSFIYAGLQGHFDLGGSRYAGPGTPTVASR